MILTDHATRLRLAYKESGRSDLDFLEMVKKFDEGFSSVMNMNALPSFEVGKYFAEFLKNQPEEQSPAITQSEEKSSKVICPECGKDFQGIKALNGHKRTCKSK